MELIRTYIPEQVISSVIIISVATLLYILGGKVVALITRRLFWRAYKRTLQQKDLEKRQKTLEGLFVNIWRILVVAIALLSLASLFLSTAQLAPLFASAGVLGVALGFGAQSLVKDFLSGLFIISENQYRVGDVVDIEGFGGTVERIGTRSTVLRDVEGNVHFFPNGMIQHVINKTMDYSMARVVVAVTPEADIEQATELIDSIGEAMMQDEAWQKKIIEAPRYVMMGDMNATAVNLIVSSKVQPSDQWTVSAELRRRILRAFEQNDIELGVASGSAVVTSAPAKRTRRAK